MRESRHCEEQTVRHSERSEESKIVETDSSVTAFPQNDDNGVICEATRTNPHPRRGNKRKVAFTLAEVLITLGVIGVVAAMTIPALINHYNKQITETRLEKFYSLFNQAIRLSVAENGEPEGWTEYWDASTDKYDDEGNHLSRDGDINSAFAKYLLPYMKVLNTQQVSRPGSYDITLFYLSDGSAFGYKKTSIRDIFFFPKNAEKCAKDLNIVGVCAFQFAFMPYKNTNDWKYHYDKGLEPYKYDWDGVKSSLYDGSIYACARSGAYCAEIIKQNGWKIPSDYPKKIRY